MTHQWIANSFVSSPEVTAHTSLHSLTWPIASPSPAHLPCPPLPPPVESHCGGPVVCAPGHAEWGVCLLLEQVVGLTDTRQTEVCDESCRVGGPGWGGDRARGQKGLWQGGGGGIWTHWVLDFSDLTCGGICKFCYTTVGFDRNGRRVLWRAERGLWGERDGEK